MRSRRGVLAAGAAAVVSGCMAPSPPSRPSPGRSIWFHTLSLDPGGGVFAVTVAEDVPGAVHGRQIALVDLDDLRAHPQRRVVAAPAPSEPGTWSENPRFADDGGALYLSRFDAADQIRLGDRAPTRIVRVDVRTGRQDTVVEAPAWIMVRAILADGDETVLVCWQATMFQARRGRRANRRSWNPLRTLRLRNNVPVPGSDRLFEEIAPLGPTWAVPGFGLVFARRSPEINPRRQPRIYVSLTLEDLRRGTCPEFTSMEAAFAHMGGRPGDLGACAPEVLRALEIFRLEHTVMDSQARLLGANEGAPEWVGLTDCDIRLDRAVALKTRSIQSGDAGLETSPVAVFRGSTTPMQVELLGEVDFVPFVRTAFPRAERSQI